MVSKMPGGSKQNDRLKSEINTGSYTLNLALIHKHCLKKDCVLNAFISL